MSRIRNDFTQREIWGDPKELSDGELQNAEKWWRSEVDRYPRGWAAIDHLNKVLAEKQARARQDRLTSEIGSLKDEISQLRQDNDSLRQQNADLSGAIGDLGDNVRDTNERLDDMKRSRRK